MDVTQPRLLILSRTGVLMRMDGGEITNEDLASSIFCFSTGKSILTADPEQIMGKRTKHSPKEVYGRLLAHIHTAEQEGRVYWPGEEDEDLRAWAASASNFLEGLGYKPDRSRLGSQRYPSGGTGSGAYGGLVDALAGSLLKEV